MLVEGFYEEQVYRGDAQIDSPILQAIRSERVETGAVMSVPPELTLAQVLKGQ